MREQWKVINGFEEYAVSNLGRIKRIIDGPGNARVGRIIKPCANGSGYMYVTLTRRLQGLKTLVKRVHVLVAKAFIPNPLLLPDVNHKGPKTDCRASRLEWRSKEGHNLDIMKRQQRGEGVNFHKTKEMWRASLFSRERRIHLGWFASKADALKARKKAVQTLEEKI
jgi:hypothetical protein